MIFQNCPKISHAYITARKIMYNNFEMSLGVLMPNISTSHAITYTGIELTRNHCGFNAMHSFASARASFNFFELVNAKQRLLRSADIASLFDVGVNSIARLQYLAIKSNSFSLYSSFPLFFHNVACLICQKKISL